MTGCRTVLAQPILAVSAEEQTHPSTAVSIVCVRAGIGEAARDEPTAAVLAASTDRATLAPLTVLLAKPGVTGRTVV